MGVRSTEVSVKRESTVVTKGRFKKNLNLQNRLEI